jgi:hypothetical protein
MNTLPMQIKPSIDFLIEKPKESLMLLQKIKRNFIQKTKDCHWDTLDNVTHIINEYKTYINYYQNKIPIFLLSECTQSFCSQGTIYQCPLSRICFPQFRQAYEEEAAYYLTKQIEAISLSRPIQYASFASGNLFSDLIIAAKALKQYPNAKITFNFIDHKYSLYADISKSLKRSYPITAKSNFQVSPFQVYDLIRRLRKKEKENPTQVPLTNTDIEKRIRFDCLQLEMPAKQFIQYLSYAFPQARLDARLHKSVKHYFKYLNQKKVSYPDVITTVDIQGRNDCEEKSIDDYHTLCGTSLLYNPLSKNTWLADKADDEPAACLIEIKLDKIQRKPLSEINEIHLHHTIRHID